ncbi:class II aldolase/adducin family protein [Methanobrevibacter olleyae]|uniref:Fuculose 1-phosphate aldolase FucA n=1 Tax=Methanobrevibacter olleyae TaxID=294671 RepID=A0A126R1A9_METOL|nr:class II aldolase/adducin family protein [Methanobrevibacter olleyae]AMK16170.1 fuculose 1-phosphate aldolase FucA [Methanobrevibacter olleyae]SFL31554.1 L-fuculose-phosphate aldolase [Methanobrevibacter olleyae]
MEKEIVKSLVEMSAYVFERGLVSGKAGNLSGRFKGESGDIVAITPTLKSLADLSEEDIVLVDENGKNLTKGKPSSELAMHLAIYREKPDVFGIVHTHSPYATGFSFSNKKIKRLEGFGAIKSKYLKEIEYFKPGSVELAEHAAEALKTEDAIVLKNHGVIATGETVKEAATLVEFVEEIAKTQFVSHLLNSIE